MTIAQFNEGKEEDFSAMIGLMERLARVETTDDQALSKYHAP
jgi:hypothetical protein